MNNIFNFILIKCLIFLKYLKYKPITLDHIFNRLLGCSIIKTFKIKNDAQEPTNHQLLLISRIT